MHKKDYPIKAGSKKYLLRYNFDALTAIEDVTGKPFFESVKDLATGMLSNLKMIFYAGLRRNHSEVSLDAIGEIIDEVVASGELNAFTTDVITAVNNYFVKASDKPKAEETEEPETETEEQPKTEAAKKKKASTTKTDA